MCLVTELSLFSLNLYRIETERHEMGRDAFRKRCRPVEFTCFKILYVCIRVYFNSVPPALMYMYGNHTPRIPSKRNRFALHTQTDVSLSFPHFASIDDFQSVWETHIILYTYDTPPPPSAHICVKFTQHRPRGNIVCDRKSLSHISTGFPRPCPAPSTREMRSPCMYTRVLHRRTP